MTYGKSRGTKGRLEVEEEGFDDVDDDNDAFVFEVAFFDDGCRLFPKTRFKNASIKL